MLSTYCASCGIKVGETEDFNWLRENVKTIKCDRCSNKAPETVSTIIQNIQQLPQAKYSAKQQLSELLIMSNKLGLYDASDLIKKYLKE